MTPKPSLKPRKPVTPQRSLTLPVIEAALLPTDLEIWQQTLGWQPNSTQLESFQTLYAVTLAGNSLLNLTRIIEPAEFWEKHLWDSLRGICSFLPGARSQAEEQTEAVGEITTAADFSILATDSPDASPAASTSERFTVIDIGTGAGFPGVPVAIVCPDWHVTLLDSTHKKIQFLDQLVGLLGLGNGQTLVDRVEIIGQHPTYRAAYDLALIRAVAPASVCAEYALPLLKIGGLAILYRGQWSAAETELLKPIAHQLGGAIERVEAFQTPLTWSDRHCLYLRKVASTPAEFPRAVGLAVQKPLT